MAWRSLMPAELIAVVLGKEPIGFLLQVNRELANSPGFIATMIVILVGGVAVDSLVFGTLDRSIRRRWGCSRRPAERWRSDVGFGQLRSTVPELVCAASRSATRSVLSAVSSTA